MSDSGRPGAGKRHGSSWLHRKHDRKYHSNVSEQETAPLLAEENDDVEDQSDQPRRGHHRHHHNDQGQESSKMFTLDNIRKNSTQILAGFAMLMSMTVIGLSIGWAIDHKGLAHRDESFCLTGDCSDAATRIFRNLASNYSDIDPCTNFAQFACGGFQDHHQLRPDQSRVGTLSIMAEENQQTLRHVLEKNASDIQPKDRTNFKKLKADYDACMDEEKIKDLGVAPLYAITEQVKAKYPVESSLRPVRNSMSQLNIRPAVQDISEAVAYMTNIGVENVLQFYVGVSLSRDLAQNIADMRCRPMTNTPMIKLSLLDLQVVLACQAKNTTGIRSSWLSIRKW
jgi:hypothetical protein